MNARKETVGPCTTTCAEKLKGNVSAVAVGSAPATAVCATKVNLAGSTGSFVSVMTSPVQDIRAFSAQVCIRLSQGSFG